MCARILLFLAIFTTINAKYKSMKVNKLSLNIVVIVQFMTFNLIMTVLMCSQVTRVKYSNAEWQTLKIWNCWFKSLYQCPFVFMKFSRSACHLCVRTFPKASLRLCHLHKMWISEQVHHNALSWSLLHCLDCIFKFSYFLNICVCVCLFVYNKHTLQNFWVFLISSCFVHHSLV